MRIRKNFLPHTITDVGASLFLALSIPITFWFEIFVVLPEFYEEGSFMYCYTFATAVFIVFNVTSNLMATMLVDTSIRGEITNPPDNPESKLLWRFCPVCESMTPPRSWHCTTCKTCILKRDHHCIFSGCCIGHKNHRYFGMLLIYLFIGTTYGTIYNSIYCWWLHADKFINHITLLKILFPGMMVLLNTPETDLFLAIYAVNIIGVCLSLTLLLYYGNLAVKGSVLYERNKRLMYDLGWKSNLKMILGTRWYLTWLSPFIKSDLPHDGIHWEEVLNEMSKNR